MVPFAPDLRAAEDTVDNALYEHHIKPLLKERCFACHGVLKQESSLRVDSGVHLFKGGDIGAAVVPGNLEESWLYQAITGEAGFLMPPEGDPLSEEEIAHVKSWIEAGAPIPETDQPEMDPQDHWAFQLIEQPALPEVKNTEWIESPVDYFIAAKHESLGLSPATKTDKATLLRRVYLDLVGLPPSREELHAFLADDRPEAYNEVVDTLLDSPHYGERWGRHWMDVWRYSDWYGRRGANDMTNSYSTIWRWRDWIIQSLNADKGYDQMIREMLAADQLYPGDREKQVATGFIVRNYYRWNYHTWLKDSVEHTGKAFLGLTFNCCECHDHKYDPIAQNEYFAMRSFFEPLDLRHNRVPNVADPGPFPDYVLSKLNPPIRDGQVQVYDRYPEKETQFYTGGVETNIVPDKPGIEAAGPAFLKGDKLEITQVELPVEAWYPGLQQFVIDEETTQRDSAVKLAYHYYKTEEASLLEQIQTREEMLNELKLQQPSTDDNSLASASNLQAIQLATETGRRTLQHGLGQAVQFDDQTTLQFRIRLIKDGLASFQLSDDLAAGRTSLYLAFTEGKVKAYVPGKGTVEQVLAQYDQLESPRHFQAELAFDPDEDQALLTLTDLKTSEPLVTQTPISIHGWRPANSVNCGIFIDAHSNTIAEFDDIVFSQTGNTEPSLNLDFEYPQYLPGNDPAGAQNWLVSRFSTGDGHSEVVLLGELTPEQLAQRQQFTELTQKVQTPKLQLAELKTRYEGATAELVAYQAVVKSEQARYQKSDVPEGELNQLMATAADLRRTANHKQAIAKTNAAANAVHMAKLLPLDQQDRDTQIKTAEQAVATAQQSLTAAEKALKDGTAEYEPLSRQFPKISTGKRAALAEWITANENPLTARVAANHLWGRHFGQPLVSTTENFGRNGAAPTHPELLNWLASELQQNGWSFKHLHRLIVTSQTYQQSSRASADLSGNKEIDRDNQFLWHYPGHRIEAEVIRDSLLKVAGELDTEFFGQEIEHEEGLFTNRRSIYLSHHGEGKMQFLEMFDVADPADCYIRKSTVLPQQALALSNSELAMQKGRQLARRLWGEIDSGSAGEDVDNEFVDQAFERILSRPATEAERFASIKFLRQQRELFTTTEEPLIVPPTEDEEPAAAETLPATEPAARARENLIHALFNHTDFITVR
ncbi:PSD1 and planctomycete cytochrome C domain-containing protein [Polystyrenella longa]|nr:PSD1 and planctomycete cytochrome C domain-containing protein [Polystyrenella longa]